MCVVPIMAVFCSFFISCSPGMLLRYFLNDFEMVISASIRTVVVIVVVVVVVIVVIVVVVIVIVVVVVFVIKTCFLLQRNSRNTGV